MSGLRDVLLPTMEMGLEDLYWSQKELPEVWLSTWEGGCR